jgi:hypothetical protein
MVAGFAEDLRVVVVRLVLSLTAVECWPQSRIAIIAR